MKSNEASFLVFQNVTLSVKDTVLYSTKMNPATDQSGAPKNLSRVLLISDVNIKAEPMFPVIRN